MQNTYSLKTIIFSIFLSSIIGIFLGYNIVKKADTFMDNANETLAVHQSGYAFINPLLECETKTYGSTQKYIPFEKDLINKIKDIQNKNSNISISVYFRNLRNGPWIGINENAPFSPASLMKLPILMMYLKWGEMDSSIFGKSLVVKIGNSLSQAFKPENQIESGSTYTIEELLKHLIVFSDNAASNTLIENVPFELEQKVFNDLSLPAPRDQDYVLNVKEYASFFRILYNASYLNRESSEAALNLLSQSVFTGGITGAIPRSIKVAHKFGEREVVDESGKTIRQLHDCGIIYYEKYPYLLCIMTKGETDMYSLSDTLQEVAKGVHDLVSSKF